MHHFFLFTLFLIGFFERINCAVCKYRNLPSGSIVQKNAAYNVYQRNPMDETVMGTDFILAFMNSHIDINDQSYSENLTLIINNPDAQNDATVTISSNFGDFKNVTITVAKRSTNRFKDIPTLIQTQYGDVTPGNFTVEAKGISVTSTLPISIVASNEHSDGGSGDQFYVLPSCQLNTDYNTVSDESMSNTTRMYSVIILEDGTDVMVHNGSRQIAAFNQLNRLQVLTYSTRNTLLTNAEVHASKKVAVISGTVCGYGWLGGVGSCSYQAIMLLPTTDYGMQFPLIPFARSQTSEFTITPIQDETKLYVNGNLLATISADSWVRFEASNEFLSSDKPIQVVQVGGYITNNYGNPFFVHVPAVPDHLIKDQFIQFATGFDTYNQNTITHFVRIVTYVDYIGRVSLDSSTPNQLAYTRVGNSKYYFYEQIIQHGTHTVSTENKNATFAVVVFGYDIHLGYGFVAGMDLPCTNFRQVYRGASVEK